MLLPLRATNKKKATTPLLILAIALALLATLRAQQNAQPNWLATFIENYNKQDLPILQVVSQDGRFRGTAFAISDTFVITAGHVANTAGIDLVAAAQGEEEVQIGTEINLRAPNTDPTSPSALIKSKVHEYHRYVDICILKLKEPRKWRATIPVEFTTAQLHEPLTVIGFAPARTKITKKQNGNTQTETIRSAQLFILPNITTVAPKLTTLWTALFFANDEEKQPCDFVLMENSLVGGSSGSPVLNSKGNAIAVFVGHMDNFGIASYLYQIETSLRKILPNQNK